MEILTIRVQCNWHSVYVCSVGTGPGFRITAVMFQYPPLHICKFVYMCRDKELKLELELQLLVPLIHQCRPEWVIFDAVLDFP